MNPKQFRPCPFGCVDGRVIGSWREVEGRRQHVMVCDQCRMLVEEVTPPAPSKDRNLAGIVECRRVLASRPVVAGEPLAGVVTVAEVDERASVLVPPVRPPRPVAVNSQPVIDRESSST